MQRTCDGVIQLVHPRFGLAGLMPLRAGAGDKRGRRVGKFYGRAVLHRRLCAGGCRPYPLVMARDLGPLFIMICPFGWLLLARLVIEFGTSSRLDVLHAVLLLCGSLTVRLIYPGQQLERLAIAGLGFVACTEVAFACCVQR